MTTTPESAEAWGAEERFAFLFPEGGPDTALSGFDVNREAVYFDPDDDATNADGTDVNWSITGLVAPDARRPHVLLIGDLQARRGGWFAGCTVVAHVDFRHEDQKPADDNSDEILRLCAWASSALYDFGAARMRSMVSASLSCHIELPRLTPRAQLGDLGRPETLEVE